VTARVHPLTSTISPFEPDVVHRRLREQPPQLAAAATGAALAACSPMLRRAGLRAVALPTVTAAASGPDDLGSVTIRWRGDDDATGWPAMTAYLVVTPTGSGSALTLFTTRVTAPELTTSRLDAVLRRRLGRALVRAFLLHLTDALASVPVGPRPILEASR
jgi:hypothetical protein